MPTTIVTGCWTLTDPYDELALWEANCHTTTREEAEKWRDKALDADDDPAEYRPYQVATTCHLVTCDTCDAVYGDPRTVHFATSREAVTAASEGGWTLTAGRGACPACQR